MKGVETEIEENKAAIKSLKKRSGMSAKFFEDEGSQDLNQKYCFALYVAKRRCSAITLVASFFLFFFSTIFIPHIIAPLAFLDSLLIVR